MFWFMLDTTTNKVIGFDLSMDLMDEIENEKSKGIENKWLCSCTDLLSG